MATNAISEHVPMADPRPSPQVSASHNAAFPLSVCSMCGTWRRTPCGEGCYWGIVKTPDGFQASVRAISVGDAS